MKFILGTANGAVNGGSGGSGGDTIHQRSTVFSLEKKRNNVQDSDNRDFHIIVLILTLTHTPEEDRTAKVASTEGEMFIVNVTEGL